MAREMNQAIVLHAPSVKEAQHENNVEDARRVLGYAQQAISNLEALDAECLTEAEQEAGENTLEQMYAVAAYIRHTYPGMLPFLLVNKE